MKQKIIRKGTDTDKEFMTQIQNHLDEGWIYVDSITPSVATGAQYTTRHGEIFVILKSTQGYLGHGKFI